MLILILLLIFSSILVYISKFNFMLVSVNLGIYVISNVPLFYVILGSVVVGLILSYLVHLFNSISTTLILKRKNKEIKKDKEEILELTKNVHQLELKNEQQKNNENLKPSDPNAL